VTQVASPAELGRPPVPEHLKPFYALEEHSMLEREPPAHTRLRRLVSRAFVARAIERLRPRVASLAEALIDRFAPQGEVELLSAYATAIPVTIIAEMLGVPVAEAPRLLDWSHRMVAMYQFGRSEATERDAVAASEAFAGFMRDCLAERRRRPGEDILSLLLEAEAAGDRLSEDELVSNAILLLNAGHEATVHAIGNAVACILQNGLDPAALFATRERTAASVEELLRFDPPLHMFTRYALEPIEWAGISLAVGDRIGLLIGAANRDPAVYDDPDRIRPDRPTVPHVSFGAGLHFSIGAPLARLELGLALPILFGRLPGLRLAEPPAYADRYHFHGLAALRLKF
jgi:cytochrome P450